METEQDGQDDEHDDRDQKQHHFHYSNVVNFYFTNFPPEWDTVNLYELFSEVGEIAHVYVARKVSKAGKRFGFARFFRVGNVLALGKRLNRIRIGTFKLSANVARFEKSISKPKMGCEKDTWAFEIPSKSNKSRSYSSSPSVSHTKFRNTLDGKSFVIHSPLELQSIWSSFNVTECKVNFLGGSRFSLEFNNSRDKEEERSGFAIFVSEDSVEGDQIKKGNNLGGCGLKNESTGCDLKNESTGTTSNSVTTIKETITDVVPACGGCEKTKADQEYCFPAQDFETENLKFESKGCSESDNVKKSDDKKGGGNGNVLSPHLVDDIIKKKSKFCHTTKQKGESKCYDTTKEKDETKENGVGKCYDTTKQKDESKCYLSPSTPPGTDINVEESCSTWLDYVSPLITDDLYSEKRWSYRDPNRNIQGPFSLAQLRTWKDFFPSDIKIWSYYGNVKKTILLHSALKRRSKDVG